MNRREFVIAAGTVILSTALPTAADDESTLRLALLERATWKVPTDVEYVLIRAAGYAKRLDPLSGKPSGYRPPAGCGTMGWKATWNGQTWGDFVIVEDAVLEDQDAVKDVRLLLGEQARMCHYMMFRRYRL